MKICNNCILPETFPGIRFDENGVCNFCREFKGKGSYDCLMAYSGGKDSTYTLWILKKKYDLRILALTFDQTSHPSFFLH